MRLRELRIGDVVLVRRRHGVPDFCGTVRDVTRDIVIVSAPATFGLPQGNMWCKAREVMYRPGLDMTTWRWLWGRPSLHVAPELMALRAEALTLSGLISGPDVVMPCDVRTNERGMSGSAWELARRDYVNVLCDDARRDDARRDDAPPAPGRDATSHDATSHDVAHDDDELRYGLDVATPSTTHDVTRDASSYDVTMGGA